MDHKFARDELIKFFAILFAETIALLVKVLTYKNVDLIFKRFCRSNFFVEYDNGACWFEFHATGCKFDFGFLRFKRKIKNGKRKHHLREIA